MQKTLYNTLIECIPIYIESFLVNISKAENKLIIWV